MALIEEPEGEADDNEDAIAVMAFVAAEKLFRASRRLGIFVAVVAALAVIATIVAATALAANAGGVVAAGLVMVIGIPATAMFWLVGSLISRAGCAYAADLMRSAS